MGHEYYGNCENPKPMKKQEDALLTLKDVNAGYDSEIILKNVNFEVYPKDFIGIIGPNGGGKTTLLKLMLGLLKPYSGEIRKNPAAGIPGYLPQYTNIDKNFPVSVQEVVLSGLLKTGKLTGRYTKPQRKKALELLEQAFMADYADKPIGELSGGQIQKTLLCRALISDPKLLILDEPNTYVDSSFEGELYRILKELNHIMAIVMVSHDVGTISSYIKTIACVNREVHYHRSNKITEQQLMAYNCPIDLITHGTVPHRVLPQHK